MPAAAAITVNDGAATPVAVTFSPESVSGGSVTFRDDRSGISVLMPRITESLSLASSNRPTNRVAFKVVLPVSKTVDGVVVLDYILRAETSFVLPDRCTEQNRKDLLAFFSNALDDALVKAPILDVEPIWG